MHKKYDSTKDKNFDDLADRFNKNVYETLKGKIRLAVLERDLEPYLKQPLSIIDAGGGQGTFSLLLAKKHKITLCDISSEMLNLARQNASQNEELNISFINCSIQELQNNIDSESDMILCHAVLEWMANPQQALSYLRECLKPNGLLSLSFFNVNSIIYKNLLKGNYRKATSDDFAGFQGSLTPINPLHSQDVFAWLEDLGLKTLTHSGIRVFNDYIADKKTRNKHPEAVIETELKFSQIEPFRSMGRYIHIVAQKSS